MEHTDDSRGFLLHDDMPHSEDDENTDQHKYQRMTVITLVILLPQYVGVNVSL